MANLRWWTLQLLNISIVYFTYMYPIKFTFFVITFCVTGIMLLTQRKAIESWYLAAVKAEAHIGPGDAITTAQRETGDIVKVEWFTSQIKGSVGIFLRARHSFLVVEILCNCPSISGTPLKRHYVLEKSAQEDAWNGIRVSHASHLPKDWRDPSSSVGIKQHCCLNKHDIYRERQLTPRLSTLIHRMSATGEYDLGMANCHHAAQVAYNLCVKDRASSVEEIPNASLVGAVAMLGVGKQKLSQSSSVSLERQDPEESTVKPGRQEHFHSHHPSTWCITPKQLYELEGLVEQTWPGEQDPSTRHVVRDFIVPKTEKSGLSYALQKNVHGMPIKYFVSQAWDYSTKRLIKAIDKVFRAKGEGNVWICFLANPQWDYEELSQLLGDHVFYSPFAKAISHAEAMIVVRDAELNLYERLWCVLELALAKYWDKTIFVVGEPPSRIEEANMGVNGWCFDSRDKRAILSMLRALPLLSPDGTSKSPDEIINMMCMKALQERSIQERPASHFSPVFWIKRSFASADNGRP